jgi:hypothetical protein
MQTLQAETTIGNVTYQVSEIVKKIVYCGINYLNELQIQAFTNEDESSGYIIYLNIKTGRKKLARIQVSYISEESIKRYGRKCVREFLPIIKTKD